MDFIRSVGLVGVVLLAGVSMAHAESKNCDPLASKDETAWSTRSDLRITIISLVTRNTFEDIKKSGALDSIVGNKKFLATFDDFRTWRESF
jgi:hypothetical protein